MSAKRPRPKKPVRPSSALTPADVRAWLATLAAGDHVPREAIQKSRAAKPKAGSEAVATRRWQRGKGSLGNSA